MTTTRRAVRSSEAEARQRLLERAASTETANRVAMEDKEISDAWSNDPWFAGMTIKDKNGRIVWRKGKRR